MYNPYKILFKNCVKMTSGPLIHRRHTARIPRSHTQWWHKALSFLNKWGKSIDIKASYIKYVEVIPKHAQNNFLKLKCANTTQTWKYKTCQKMTFYKNIMGKYLIKFDIFYTYYTYLSIHDLTKRNKSHIRLGPKWVLDVVVNRIHTKTKQ